MPPTDLRKALSEEGKLRAEQPQRIAALARKALAAGMEKQEIAALAHITRPTLNTWLKKY